MGKPYRVGVTAWLGLEQAVDAAVEAVEGCPAESLSEYLADRLEEAARTVRLRLGAARGKEVAGG